MPSGRLPNASTHGRRDDTRNLHRFWFGNNNIQSPNEILPQQQQELPNQAEQARADQEQFFDAQEQITDTNDGNEEIPLQNADNQEPFWQAESFAQTYEDDFSIEDNTTAAAVAASSRHKNRRTGYIKEYMKRIGSSEYNKKATVHVRKGMCWDIPPVAPLLFRSKISIT